MTKINGTEIAEVDDSPGYGRISADLVLAACKRFLLRNGAQVTRNAPHPYVRKVRRADLSRNRKSNAGSQPSTLNSQPLPR